MESDHLEIKRLLRYDPDTGLFFWRQTGRGRVIFKQAGALRPDGYRSIGINGRRHLAHRVAWLISHGSWPNCVIDHINGVRDDNRLSNLRDVSKSTNSQNQKKPHKNSSTGVLGVKKVGERFHASITTNGRCVTLGSAESALEAHEIYLAAKRAMHPGCTI